MKPIRFRFILCVFTFLVSAKTTFAINSDYLPPIDARKFDITPTSKSSTGKVYLFHSKAELPKTGNLIMVFDHEKPLMAFRVLKNDSIKNEFIAKRVRRYGETSTLNLNVDYQSTEKLGDVIPPPSSQLVPLTAQETLDQTSPDELTQEPPVTAVDNTTTPETVDPNLDEQPASTVEQKTESAETTPVPEQSSELAPPEEKPESNDPELDDSDQLDADTIKALDEVEEANPEDEEDYSSEIEEHVSLSPYNNILSVTAGYFGNSSNFSLSPYLSNGFSLSYTRELFNELIFSNSGIQDSFLIEGGMEHYVVVNKDSKNDQYTLFPFYLNSIYMLHLSKNFSLAAYGGIQYNFMSHAVNAGSSLNTLQGLQPNFGLTAFYRIGPQWFFRADIGWDRITGGLSIKW